MFIISYKNLLKCYLWPNDDINEIWFMISLNSYQDYLQKNSCKLMKKNTFQRVGADYIRLVTKILSIQVLFHEFWATYKGSY